MELLGPMRIFLLELTHGHITLVPLSVVALRTTPAGIGQDAGSTILDVVLHNVNLATFGPLVLVAKQPDGGPGTRCRGNLCSNLEAAVTEGVPALCGETGRRIIGIATIVAPVIDLRIILLVHHPFDATFDIEHAIVHSGIVGLIVLQLLVAHKARLVGPVLARTAFALEFVVPNQLIAFIPGNVAGIGGSISLFFRPRAVALSRLDALAKDHQRLTEDDSRGEDYPAIHAASKLDLEHHEAIGFDVERHTWLHVDNIAYRFNSYFAEGVSILGISRKDCALGNLLHTLETGKIDLGNLLVGAGIAHLDEEFARLHIEHNALLLMLVGTFDADTIAVVILTCRLAEHLLHIVAACRIYALVVEIDEVGCPVAVVLAGEERGIGCHLDHIGITLDVHQIDGLGKCIEQLVVASTILCGILAQIDLGLAVAGIVVVLTAVEIILCRLVVVLVDDGKTDLFGKLPRIIIVGVAGVRTRTCCAHDDDFGMSSHDTVVDVLETLHELGRDALLVADAQVLQIEWFGMSGLSTYTAPFGGYITIGPFDEVEGFVNPFVHLVHRTSVLCLVLHAPTAVDTLAADTTRKDGKRLHTDILAELEILEVSKSHALVIAPGVLELLALMLGTQSGLPTVGVPEAIAATMNHATAGETHETWMHGLQCLGKVLAKAMAHEGIFGHQRYGIDVHLTHGEYENLEDSIRAIFCWFEDGLHLVPIGAYDLYGLVGQQLLFTTGYNKSDAHFLGLAAHVTHKGREVVLGARLHVHAVEAIVLEAYACPAIEVIVVSYTLDENAHVVEVVDVQRIGLQGCNVARRVSGTDESPGCARAPAGTFASVVFEGSVLHQFGIEAAIGCITDVFEEDSNQVITDSLTASRSGHGTLRPKACGCQKACTENCCSFHVVIGL